jgi:hypothetical protein
VLHQSIGPVSKVVLNNSGAGGCFILFLPFACLCAEIEEPRVTFGLTAITGSDSGHLDRGGNLQAGAGHFVNRYFGIEGSFMCAPLPATARRPSCPRSVFASDRIQVFACIRG